LAPLTATRSNRPSVNTVAFEAGICWLPVVVRHTCMLWSRPRIAGPKRSCGPSRRGVRGSLPLALCVQRRGGRAAAACGGCMNREMSRPWWCMSQNFRTGRETGNAPMHGTRDRGSTRCPPAPAGGFLCAAEHAPKRRGRAGTQNRAAARAPKTVRQRKTQEAPGGNPGTPRVNTTPSTMLQTPTRPLRNAPMHGTRDHMRPGVPRLPPGAFCVRPSTPQNGVDARAPKTARPRGHPKRCGSAKPKKPRVETRGLLA